MNTDILYSVWKESLKNRDMDPARHHASNLVYAIERGENEPSWGSRNNRHTFIGWCMAERLLTGEERYLVV